jgi:hypothetical protein
MTLEYQDITGGSYSHEWEIDTLLYWGLNYRLQVHKRRGGQSRRSPRTGGSSRKISRTMGRGRRAYLPKGVAVGFSCSLFIVTSSLP